jgi:nucleotide-binding universal stress UspA family protein
LFPVDDSDDSQRAFDWMLQNFYKDGDEVHIVNVISRMQFAATLGVPAVDFTPQINRDAYEAVIRKSEAFIVKRFLGRMPPAIATTPIVHIIKVRFPRDSARAPVPNPRTCATPPPLPKTPFPLRSNPVNPPL